MRASSFMRDTITFLANSTAVDSHGVPRESYAEGTPIAAHVVPMSERERAALGRSEFGAEVIATIDTEHAPKLGDRARWSGDTDYEYTVIRVDRRPAQTKITLTRETRDA